MLRFTNTLTQSKEIFEPHNKNHVNMYVCGVTPYDYSHIGHGRCYVFFDFVYRFLQFLGYDVTYCRNYTDLDDKLLKKAFELYGKRTEYKKVAQDCITAFEKDMQALGCLQPDIEPRVTEYVTEIIDFIQQLIDRGYAYEAQGSVYYRVEAFDGYGKLSKRQLDDMQAGARVEVNAHKENALDFVLWKAEEHDVGFSSPWGPGRPGWHIECSTFVKKCIGESVDIHGGGMDLIFPHHENEIAQSEALTHKQFAKYWLHNAFVRIDNTKMSKSLDNFFTLRDIFEKIDPMVLRFYLLRHWYRGPLDFALQDVQADAKAYTKLVQAFSDVDAVSHASFSELQSNEIISKMLDFLYDDCNTAGAFGVLFEKLPLIKDNIHIKKEVKCFIQKVFGLKLDAIQKNEVVLTPEIQAMIEQRNKARSEKDWKTADKLRDALRELGVVVEDKKA